MTDAEGLMDRTAQTNKEASGILVYLIEELGDARLRASQLKQYVAAALEMVEKSEKKDHFFEVAGDLLHGIPDTLFKMDKALDAAAMAASRMDYEEIKQGLRPEKADELERVLEDVRLQYLNRRSENMNAKSAAEMLDVFAMVTDTSGKVPAADLAGLIDRLEQGHKQASGKDPAQFFREAAEYLRSTQNPSRRELAATLRRVLADNLDLEAGAGEQFKKENPDLSDEAVKKINEQHEKNKNVVKDLHKEADDANVLTDFEAAFRAAKVAKANADAGNEKKAALFGLHAIQEMAEALAGITPKFSDKMLAIAAKAESLRAGVVSDAARSDALPVTAGLEDGYGVNKYAAMPTTKQVKKLPSGWTLTWNPTKPDHMSVDDDEGGTWSDEAMLFRGKITYDFPERIPVDVRDAVRKFFNLLKRSKSASDDYGLGLTARHEKGKHVDPTEGYAHTKTAAKVNWKPGDRLTVAPVGPALQSSLPASKWLTKETVVEAMEEGGNHGLDVYDVSLDDGSEESIYGFQVIKKSKGKTAADDYGLSASDEVEAAGKNRREEKSLADLIVFGPTGFQIVPMTAKEAEEILRSKYDYSDSDIKRLKTASDDFDMEAGAGEQFKKVNPDISDEAVERINEQHEKNKDVVKDKAATYSRQ